MDFYLIGGIILGVIVLFVSVMAFITKNYVRIPPNMAAVLFGRKHRIKNEDGSTTESGFRLITGGGVFKIPFFEEVQFMDLSNRQINISVEDAPNKDGVMTTVEGIANVKFASTKDLLRTAVERFLGKNDQEVNKIIFQNLEGHLRSVIGQMTMEELIGNKQRLNETILSDANEDFEKMGIKIDFLNIADIRDKDNYIENLGRKRAAEIQRDADIGEAEAKRETVIKTTTADREGIEKANENEQRIAESNRERDVVRAKMKAEVDRENEIANQAGPKSNAEALKAVVEAQAATSAAQERANIKVEEERAKKKEKALYADQIVPAETEKKAKIVTAEGLRESTVIEAEGRKQATIKEAEGNAESIKLNALAEADGEAAQIQRTGEAEANATKAKLLAEAEGIEAKALAYEKLDQTGKFLEVLNALQTLGPNMIREFAGVMGATTQHFGNIDELKVIDFGGNGGNGGSTLANLGKVPTEVMTKFFESAKASGLDVTELFKWVGFKPEDISGATAKTETLETAADSSKTPKAG